MPSKPVPDLPAAATLDGSELMHVVQGGNSRKTSVDNLQAAIAVPFASVAEVRSAASSKAVPPDALQASAAFQVLAAGATIAWDLALGYNATVELGAAANAIQAPTNPKEGLTYSLLLVQDATGSRTATWPTEISFGAAGEPDLSTAPGKKDLVSLICLDAAAPEFRAVFNKDA